MQQYSICVGVTDYLNDEKKKMYVCFNMISFSFSGGGGGGEVVVCGLLA